MDSTTLHSIRKALNGFQWGNCSGRTEQIDGYTFCMLLPVEQQHQKHLIDNYSRGSSERDTALGGHEFQEDIRFGEGRKNTSAQPHSVGFQLTVTRILGSISQVCNSNPIIVFLQIQYISRSLLSTCNWLLQVCSTRLISSFRHLNAEPIWQRPYSSPLLINSRGKRIISDRLKWHVKKLNECVCVFELNLVNTVLYDMN